MERIIPLLRYSTKQRLIRRLKKCREAKLRTRYLIIINLDGGRSPTQTAAALHVSRTTIYRVAERYQVEPEKALSGGLNVCFLQMGVGETARELGPQTQKQCKKQPQQFAEVTPGG